MPFWSCWLCFLFLTCEIVRSCFSMEQRDLRVLRRTSEVPMRTQGSPAPHFQWWHLRCERGIWHQWGPESSVRLHQVQAAGTTCRWLAAVFILSTWNSLLCLHIRDCNLVGFTLELKLQFPSHWHPKQIVKRNNYQQSHSWLEF